MAKLIKDELMVSIHYTLTDDNGNVIDSSADSEPLTYLHGAGFIIPGLEKALLGKKVGDSLKVRIEPEEAYGKVYPELIQTVNREVFEGVESIEEGMMFDAEAPDGSCQHIVIKKVDGDQVTIDANHPLAGMNLNFDVRITEVRKPTAEELEYGHSHDECGESCCHHG